MIAGLGKVNGDLFKFMCYTYSHVLYVVIII